MFPIHHSLFAPLLACALSLGMAPRALEGGAPIEPTRAPAKVFLTLEEALELAFPGCEVERRAVYLTRDQERRVAELAQVPYEGRVARPYVATRDGRPVGTAYFDAHRVRTLRETLMVVVDPAGRIRRIEILSFGEPEEYIPRGNWYGQFVGRALDDDLRLGRGVRAVTGATLTARATTDCARRTLALHQLLGELEPEVGRVGSRGQLRAGAR